MILNRSKYLEMIDQLEKVVISVTDRMRNDPDRVYERERTIKECNAMIRKYKKRIEF
jgi:DNA repair ATPase RecN